MSQPSPPLPPTLPDSAVRSLFPGLLTEPYTVTSPKTHGYNCVAWAAGDTTKWWWPFPENPLNPYYWPPGVRRDLSPAAFVAAFASHGFKESTNAEFKPDLEKLAIYAKNGATTHMARQLRSGVWTSKLGPSFDIEHASITAIEGPAYGKLVVVLERPLF